MKKKLPIINVTGCHDCPFQMGGMCYMLEEDMDGSASPMAQSVEAFADADSIPKWCPGKEYHVIVEFPE